MTNEERRAAILGALEGGKSYGRRIAEALNLHRDTIYPTLRAMERDGLLRSWEADPSAERGWRPVVWYELTDKGRFALAWMRAK